jgi:N-acetylmuramoyl-L-alanine amidase
MVTVDPGHGGVDPGNPGTFFPRGVREKNVTLQVGLLLRDELKRRGVAVRMTRTTDTLIALGDRGGYCTEACDLFVSLHVNSLARRKGYTDVRGFETFFLAEAKTEDAARVAQMENEAVRFETGVHAPKGDPLAFIINDMAQNEHLRESSDLAGSVQRSMAEIHPGPSRGVRQANFAVLRTSFMPAVLIEIGFGTNPADAAFISDAVRQQRIANAIADATSDYLNRYERRVSPGTN